MLAARRRLAEKKLPRECDVLLVEQTTQTADAPARPRKAGLTGVFEGSNQSVAPRLRRYLAHPLVGRTRRGQGEAHGVTDLAPQAPSTAAIAILLPEILTRTFPLAAQRFR